MTERGTHPDRRLSVPGSAASAWPIALRRAGHDDFVILERAADVGGVWRDNSYPGAACDVVSRMYSFSFDQDYAWSTAFRAAAGDFRLYPRGGGAARPAPLHAVQYRGRERPVRRGRGALAPRDRGGRRDRDAGPDLGGRPVQPRQDPGLSGPRPLQGRAVPLGGVAARCRSAPARPSRSSATAPARCNSCRRSRRWRSSSICSSARRNTCCPNASSPAPAIGTRGCSACRGCAA